MNNLLDRYVVVALEHVPSSRHDDVAREIRAAANDMIDARIQHDESEHDATRGALSELGDPQALARQFAPSHDYLIGPQWFPLWQDVVVKVAPLVAALVGIITAVSGVLDSDRSASASITSAIIQGVWTAIDTGLQVLIWVTIVFAILERNMSRVPKEHVPDWSIDDLPSQAMKRQITMSDTLSSIIGLGAFAAIASWFTRGGTVRDIGDGESKNIPLLNPDLDQRWVVLFLALICLSIIVALIHHVTGFWTQTSLALAVAENAMWVIAFALIAWKAQVINPRLSEEFPDLKGRWWAIGDQANQVLFVAVLIVSVSSVWSALRGHREYLRLKAAN